MTKEQQDALIKKLEEVDSFAEKVGANNCRIVLNTLMGAIIGKADYELSLMAKQFSKAFIENHQRMQAQKVISQN